MFKSICVAKGKWLNAGSKLPVSGPEYGDICTVLETNEEGFLVLAEWPRPNNGGFSAENFIPLSSIDETEMQREYKTEKV